MTNISERLRASNPYQCPEITDIGTTLIQAADVIDALVSALDEAGKFMATIAAAILVIRQAA